MGKATQSSDEVLCSLKEKEKKKTNKENERSKGQRDLKSVVVLFIDNLLRLLLLTLEESANPSQGFLRQNQAGSNNRLARSKDTITTTLFVLRAIHIEDMVLDIAGDADRQRGTVVDGTAQLLGVLLEDREAGIDLGQTLVTEGVGAGYVGSDIAVWGGEVG